VTRLTRWSMDHRRLVVALWVVALVAALGVARGAGSHFDNNLTLPGTGAERAATLLKSRFPAESGDSDQVVLHVRAGSVRDRQIRAAVGPMLQKVRRLPHVTDVTSPYAAGRVSADGKTAFATVAFDVRGDALSKATVQRVIDVARSARSKRLDVELGGNAIEQSQRPSLGAATAIGIGAAVVILLLSFGSLLAMSLPIAVALFGLGTGMGLIAVLTHLLATPDFATQLALLVGLGVGVDYALFIVSRFRDAYAAERGDVRAAVETAMNTAGRSVAFAGITVVIAVMGLFVAGVNLLYGVAIATSLSVLLVLAASLTLLPALLTFFGRRIGDRRRKRAQGARWLAWISAIQRHPALAALVSTGFLLLLAAPALGLRLAASDAGNDEPSTTTRQAYDLLSRGFGQGFNGPLSLAVQLRRAGDTAWLPRLTRAVRATPGVAAVSPPRLNGRRDTVAIVVTPSSAPQSSETYALVERLRGDVLPPIARAAGASVYVGGFTASQVDFAHVLSRNLPLFIGMVVALSALLLLVVFRSLLIPLQAALMNLLSIGAALGVVQAIFERGWLKGLVGAQQAPIEAFIPVIVFAIVFGLSMDYEVFLVSRVHEEWLESGDSTRAVREGLVRTGRVITAAAAVMIVVFASFASSSNHILKLFGLTLAVAVVLDAVVIRTILLPAVLQLLGRSTWSFPAWLDRRLPRIAIEPSDRAASSHSLPLSDAA
jgi:putative drug exporter of the RND superfamily